MGRTQINSDLIKDGAITANDIENNSITTEKLNINSDLNFNGNRILNLGSPQNPNDAVNKAYVDNAISGFAWQRPVKSIISTLPSNPQIGDRYLINSGSDVNKILEWNGVQWVHYIPSANWAVFVEDTDKGYTYNAEATSTFKWIEFFNNVSLPPGNVNQTLRHNGVGWTANSVLTIENDKVNVENKLNIIVNNEQVSDVFSIYRNTNNPFSNWSYKRKIIISSYYNLTDYNVKIVLNTQFLINSNKLQSDCRDLRFLDSNFNEIPYWIEDGINTSNTIIWIKLNLNYGENIIYMFYGNPQASYPNYNPNNIFIFFDDFENYNVGDDINNRNGWITDRIGGSGEAKIRLYNSQKHLRLYSTSSGTSVKRLLPFGNDYAVRSKVVATDWDEAYVKSFTDGTIRTDGNLYNGYDFVYWGWYGSYSRITRGINGDRVILSEMQYYGYNNVYYTVEITRTGSSLKMFRNDNLLLSASDNYYNNLNYLNLVSWSGSDHYVKWIFVRKYVSIEPTFSIGVEENNLTGTNLLIVKNDGKIGVKNNTPLEDFDINGNIKFNNKLICRNGVIRYDTNKWQVSNDGNAFFDLINDKILLNIPISNGDYSGKIVLGVAGENLSLGDVCYLSGDGKYYKASNSNENNIVSVMALENINANFTGRFLISGYVRNNSWSFADHIGRLFYLGSNGGITFIRPTTGLVQILGKVEDSNVLFFNPDYTTLVVDEYIYLSRRIVFDQNVSSVSSVTVSGLNGNLDGVYRIIVQGTINATSDRWMYITPNNATGDTYKVQQHKIACDGSSTTGEEINIISIPGFGLGFNGWSSNNVFYSEATIIAKTGVPRLCNAFFVSHPPGQDKLHGARVQSVWRNTTANITSLVFYLQSGGTFTGNIKVMVDIGGL